jgi:uncharacterized membrane protein YjjP (DUF1212 family)
MLVDEPPSDGLFIQLLAALAAALHRYGAPAHLIEDAIRAVAAGRGVEAQVLSTPTSITLATGGLQDQQLRLVRIEPGTVDLRRLTEVDILTQRIARGEVTDAAALAQVQAIHDARPGGTFAVDVGAATMTSAMAALFFGGGWLECLTAGVIGASVGLAQGITGRSVRLQRIVEPTCAMLAALLAAGVCAHVGPLDGGTTILSGLIALLPGFTLTVSMTELASRHLVSGSARFASAAMTFLQLGFGAAVGLQLGRELGWNAAWSSVPPAGWAELLPALVLGALSFAVLLRVRRRDLGAVLVVAVAGYIGSLAGVQFVGPQLGVFGGALVVGTAANIWSRWRQLPAAVVSVPGILMLVPGSVGFRGVSAFFDADVLAAANAASTMFVLAASLVAGLLTANVVVAPRGVASGG